MNTTQKSVSPNNKLRGKNTNLQKCQVCGKEVYITDDICTRCRCIVNIRTKSSLKKTVAFLIMAMFLYIPSNLLPMLIFNNFGSATANTIFEGILNLFQERMYGIALIIFVASVVIPVFKIIGLSLLVFAAKYCSYAHIRKYIFLYSLIERIGRWSMLDLFVISVMLTLIHFAPFISVTIGWGTSAFGCVVVLTILAGITFDPRLLWDAAEKNQEKEVCQNG